MRVLLDTQAFLWWINDSPELSTRARRVLRDPDNALFLSLASVWEMAIKASRGKLAVPGPIEAFVPQQLQVNGVSQLDISFRHVARVERLPFHHSDPFDRLIIAQALTEGIPVITSDRIFARYGIKRLW